MKRITIITLMALGFSSCSRDQNTYDASGTFEAIETIVSAEAQGTIQALDIEEGQSLQAGQYIGYIDSLQLYLKKRQIQAQTRAVLSRKPDVSAQTAALQEQLKQARHELERITALTKADAATAKQLDDAKAQVTILNKQIEAQRSALDITASGLDEDASPLALQVAQLEDQLRRCRIINPVEGTVLAKYAEAHETATPGKPLYKIAPLDQLILRAYITGDQLAGVRLNQSVQVRVDAAEDASRSYEGRVTWISDKAEFTPKTIQTRDERANLVYAVRIKVKNDGNLKIGMYGEASFGK